MMAYNYICGINCDGDKKSTSETTEKPTINASQENVDTFILGETLHTSNEFQKATGQQIEAPSNNSHYPQPPYPPTTYDYLALAPTLLVAATPLILRWLDHRNKR